MTDSPRELSVTTLIDAAPDKVWQVMTERTAEWWCPKPWTVTLDDFDLKSGGRCAMTMHGPEGETMPTDGIFHGQHQRDRAQVAAGWLGR